MNVDALRETLAALEDAGRLERVDEAKRAVALGLAAAVDGDPSNAALWREYRAAIRDLMEAGVDDGDDAFSDWLSSLPAKVRD